jgi:hypothetical protein
MYKKLSLLILALVFCMVSSSVGETIVWVNENLDPNDVPYDQELIDLLEGLGFEVITNPLAWVDLTDENLEALNNADLIMISRNTNSGGYADNEEEITAWNSIETPLMLLSCYLTRSNRWQWINSETIEEYQTESSMVVVDETHPIFSGIPTGAPLDIIDESVAEGQNSFLMHSDVGNGLLIAQRELDQAVWIAEWVPGVPFYDGTDQVPAGKRMYYVAGGYGGQEAGQYNLTETGMRMFINAVYYMLGTTPRLEAFLPNPSDGQIEVPRDASLSWKAGAKAVAHNVYFGTDPNDVNDATMDDPRDVLVSPSQTETTYQIADLFDYGVTYYWRIDEVNDLEPNSPWKGNMWSIEVLNFPIVVEDFEDYNDYTPNEVFMTWLDGYGVPTNGSTAGYPEPDFVGGGHYLEDTIVHGGQFSLPLFYDNSVGLSEVTRTLGANWNQEGVVTLTLFYYGDPNNGAEQMFVAVDNVVVNNDDANAALVAEWTQWDIPLEILASQGVNLSNVGSMTIGFGNRANPVAGGEGCVFFDDIRLYRPWP